MAEPVYTSAGQGPDHHLAGGWLTIDLDALAYNYRALAETCRPARTAAVVKADAYGIGIEHAVPALAAAGCDTFFVALAEEGLAVREAAPNSSIFVFNGLFGAETASTFAAARLMPVLNTTADIAVWEAHGHEGGEPLPCAIHVDTGMNRLGLTPAEAASFGEDNALTHAIRPVLVMSHLACADDQASPMNARQRESFQEVAGIFEGVALSLANSGGVFLGKTFHCDLTRPGIALYGGEAAGGIANPMRPVVTARARVLQVRRAAAGESVSYGATARLARDTLIAIVASGYADGYHRAGSGSGVPLREAVANGAAGFVNGRRVPVLGRVTMDLTMFDVTELGPDGVAAGDAIELFGPNIALDDAARAAGTIGYELLTGLGRRYQRHYVGGEAS